MSVTSIGNYAFCDCSNLTSVTIPEGVTSIEDRAFNRCSSLTSIDLPDSLTYLGVYCFAQCNALSSLKLPNSPTFIDDSAFYDCRALTSVTIPNNLTSLEATNIFANCRNLESVTLGNSIAKINIYNFENCDKLSDVYFDGLESEWLSKDIKDDFNGATIHYLRHVIVTDESIAPTCTESGLTEGSYCSDCGEVYSEQQVVPALGHDAGDWEVVTPATCKASGTKVKYCTRCGVVIRSEIIPVIVVNKVHSVSIDDQKISYRRSSIVIPVIDADSGVNYTVTFTSSNPSAIKVDNSGRVTSVRPSIPSFFARPSATITCTVTDQNGNTVSDTCKVTVKFIWWQWIVKILLFGWIWY